MASVFEATEASSLYISLICVRLAFVISLPSVTCEVDSQPTRPDTEYEESKPRTLKYVTVKTDCGPVRGVLENSSYGQETHVFKGIPYTKPPVQKRRWKPPRSLAKDRYGRCWEGTRDATKASPPCAQIYPPFNTTIFGSEDCLYLNVWAPKRKRRRLLPVFVWIHPGGLVCGDGLTPGYSPNPDFVHAVDVIAVSMNYRLNAFGFLTLEILSENSPHEPSANYGVLDMIEALKWVQRNIKAFGGNPKLVTIAGHSSGGKAVYALLASPLAQGLFHRAITTGAPSVYRTTLAKQAKDNDAYIDRAMCRRSTKSETLNCLYNLTRDEVIQAIPWYTFPYWFPFDLYDLPTKGRLFAALAVIDPFVVPVSPLNLYKRNGGRGDKIPILIATSSEEAEKPLTRLLTEAGKKVFKHKVAKRLDTFSTAITKRGLELYLSKDTSEVVNYGLIYIEMVTAIRVLCPSNVISASLAATRGRRVYRLVISAKPSRAVIEGGTPYIYSYHGWPWMAAFDFKLIEGGNYGPLKLYKPSAGDNAVRDTLQQEIASFVRQGKPLTYSWKRFPRVTAVLTNKGMMLHQGIYNRKKCHFWDKNGFFIYGWTG